MTYTVRPPTPAGWPAGSPAPRSSGAYRLVTDYVTDPRPRRVVVAHPAGAGHGRRPGLKVYVRLRRDGQRQRRRRAEQRRRRRRRRGPGHHGAGQLGPEHRDQRGEPRLRGPAVRRAARRPAVPGRQQRLRRHRQRRAGPAGRRPHAGHDVRRGAGRQRRADRAGGRRPRRPVHARARLRADRAAGDRRRRRVRRAHRSSGPPAATRRPGATYDQRLRPPPPRLPGLSTRRPTGSARRTGCRRTCSRPARTRPSPAPWSRRSPARGGRRSAPATPRAASRSTSAPTARCSPATCTSRSPGCWPPATCATARATVRFLFERQQLADGRFPRNSLLNGKLAPDTGGDQLDETAYPILMAYQAGLAGRPRRCGPTTSGRRRTSSSPTARRSAPSGGRSRAATRRRPSPPRSPGWSRPAGSPTCNGDHAARAGLPGHRRPLPAHRSRAGRSPPPARTRPAATSSGCPRTATRTRRSPTTSATAARPPTSARSSTPGFLELTRLGILPADRPRRAPLAAGRGRDHPARHRRAGPASTATAPTTPGTEDGYGDCYEPDATDCSPYGQAVADRQHRLRPPVAGAERRARRAAAADRRPRRRGPAAARRCSAFSSGIGLVPEQAWENPDLAAVAVRHRPGDRVDRLRRRRAGRLGLAADLGAGAAGAADPEPRAARGRWSSRRSCAQRYQPRPPARAPVDGHRAGRRRHGDHRDRSTSPAPPRPGATVDVASTATDTGGATSVVDGDGRTPTARSRPPCPVAVRHLGDHRRRDHDGRRHRVRAAHGRLRLHHRARPCST